MSALADSPYAVTDDYRRAMGYWLLTLGMLMLGMILLSGVLRLTGLGLSMADWKPISITVPPITAEDWRQAFEQYQIFPEHHLKNFSFDLEQFKKRYWIEYAHSLLDLIIAAVFLGPWVYFMRRYPLPRNISAKLAAIFALGLAQGLLDIYLAFSGLNDVERLTQYRLTAHIALAVLIYGYVLWFALRLIRGEPGAHSTFRVPPRASIILFGVLLLVFIMIISGGLMAGTGAGLVYNTFPLMAGHWIPPEIYELRPVWRNYFENITMIQFQHRVLAVLLITVASGLVYRRGVVDVPVPIRRLFIVLFSAIGLQFIVGIATLLNRVPDQLALFHQSWAMVVFSIAVATCALLETRRR